MRRLRAVAAHVVRPPPSSPSSSSSSASSDGDAAGIVDLEFFRAHGYVVVPQAVPPSQVAAAVGDNAALLGMDMANPAEWYNDSGGEYGQAPLEVGPGMVELYQSQGLWDNRCAPRVHRAFAEILGSDQLLVTMDRCNFKPPTRGPADGWNKGLPLHWDGPRPGEATPFTQELGVQGALFLSGAGPGSGGFMCVDGFAKEWEEHGLCTEEGGALKGLPFADQPFASRAEPIEVTGKAGDLLIWNRLLPHGNAANMSDTPRIAQFISMYRKDAAPRSRRRFGVSPEDELDNRVGLWQKKKLGSYSRWEGVDGGRWGTDGVHPEGPEVAKLTDLGLKLLGIEEW